MKSKNITIFFIIFYLWILVTNPQSRFPILAAIHFERIVMLIAWIILIFSKRINIRVTKIAVFVLIFYIVLNVSYLLSPYQNYYLSQHWFANYWKIMILFFLILFSINDIKDISYIFTGFVVILFLYQAHSWFDFLHGGSYVWQAGIKRMVGIWSEGVGAANYFGMIALFSLPFALFWFKATEDKKIKIVMVFYFIMTFFSILYSGTRGAMLGFIFFLLINIRSWKLLKISIPIFILLSTFYVFLLPDYLKHRFFSLTPLHSETNYKIGDKFEEGARKSALGRLTGLKDGFKIAKRGPIFGNGPGSSALVRKEVNKELYYDEETDWQLHSLYGQVMAETGFLGTIMFFSIIILYFYQFRRIKDITKTNSGLGNYKLALQNGLLLLLFYGFASHTLYRFNWFLLFACQGAFIDIVSNIVAKTIKKKSIPSVPPVTSLPR